MKAIYKDLLEKAVPFLKKGKKKDFVLHTKWVIKSMEMLLIKEKGEMDLLLPASILHDVGWAKVPLKIQKDKNRIIVKKALELHLKYNPPITRKILNSLGYDKNKIEKIIEIILAHKFQDPKDLNKRLLIDADTLSDIFSEPFYEDVRQYRITPKENYDFRKENKFYTKTAKFIFNRELNKRRKEIKNKRNHPS